MSAHDKLMDLINSGAPKEELKAAFAEVVKEVNGNIEAIREQHDKYMAEERARHEKFMETFFI